MLSFSGRTLVTPIKNQYMKRSFIQFPIALCVFALVSCSSGTNNNSSTSDSTTTNNAANGTDSIGGTTTNPGALNNKNTTNSGTIPDSTSTTGN